MDPPALRRQAGHHRDLCRNARRDLTKGQKALALIYPEGEKGGRGKNVEARKAQESGGFSSELLRQARQIAHHPDLVDMVRLGTKSFDVALTEAKRRSQAATSEEAQLARLQAEAPDVAALVVEDQNRGLRSRPPHCQIPNFRGTRFYGAGTRQQKRGPKTANWGPS